MKTQYMDIFFGLTILVIVMLFISKKINFKNKTSNFIRFLIFIVSLGLPVYGFLALNSFYLIYSKQNNPPKFDYEIFFNVFMVFLSVLIYAICCLPFVSFSMWIKKGKIKYLEDGGIIISLILGIFIGCNFAFLIKPIFGFLITPIFGSSLENNSLAFWNQNFSVLDSVILGFVNKFFPWIVILLLFSYSLYIFASYLSKFKNICKPLDNISEEFLFIVLKYLCYFSLLFVILGYLPLESLIVGLIVGLLLCGGFGVVCELKE